MSGKYRPFDSFLQFVKKSRQLQVLSNCIFSSGSKLKYRQRLSYFIEPEAKKSKAGAKKTEKEAAGEGAVLYEDPPDQKTSPSGKSATLKICSWNVDGLRAWIKKKGLDVSGMKGRVETDLGV